MAKTEISGDAIARAEKSLERHLAWVGRFDTRTSLIVGITIAMLGVIASLAPPLAKWTVVFWCSFLGTGALLAGCLIALYVGLFPKTTSPNSSLLYFGTICGLKPDEFRRRLRAQSDIEYFEDLADQCHVNAGILSRKFTCLKVALALLLVAAFPWAFTVFLAKHFGQ